MMPEDDRPGGRPTSGPTRRRASRAGRGAATTSIEADLERATAMLAQTSGQSRDADTGPLEAEMQRAETMLSGIAGPSAAGPSALGQARTRGDLGSSMRPQPQSRELDPEQRGRLVRVRRHTIFRGVRTAL